MPLGDAQIERYSRQIILPEVGGRGQERLLAARVAVAGAGAAAVTAATLLGRAGVGALDLPAHMAALPELSPECRLARTRAPGADADVTVDLAGDETVSVALGQRAQATGRLFVLGTLHGTRVAVATLVGRPCIACVAHRNAAAAPDPGPLAAPAALALGALAASEVLRTLLLLPARGRITTLELVLGTCSAVEPAATGGCAVCGGSA